MSNCNGLSESFGREAHTPLQVGLVVPDGLDAGPAVGERPVGARLRQRPELGHRAAENVRCARKGDEVTTRLTLRALQPEVGLDSATHRSATMPNAPVRMTQSWLNNRADSEQTFAQRLVAVQTPTAINLATS